MKKKYLAIGALTFGLLATPAIASAFGTGAQADRVGTSDDGNWMEQMHESVSGADGSGVEWMEQMHDSVFGPDGSGVEWMEQMHDSVIDGHAFRGGMMGGGMMGFSR